LTNSLFVHVENLYEILVINQEKQSCIQDKGVI